MKSLSSIIFKVASGIVVVAAFRGSPAMAQTVPAVPVTFESGTLARLAADLAYPTSAQRFFEAGNEQFEQEIRQLLDEDEPSEPLLTVKPEVLKQFEER